nr:MAG TPA: hypothetical protein [Caudoviricetes sp.]
MKAILNSTYILLDDKRSLGHFNRHLTEFLKQTP